MSEAEDLNYDCNYNLFLAKSFLSNLESQADRQRAIRWLRKLAAANRSIEEMKIRNQFMFHLVINLQKGQLAVPFKLTPPAGPLPALKHLLPPIDADCCDGARSPTCPKTGQHKCVDESLKQPLLEERSPDGGAFLASQPIPRCGAFCYVAVVSKPKAGNE